MRIYITSNTFVTDVLCATVRFILTAAKNCYMTPAVVLILTIYLINVD